MFPMDNPKVIAIEKKHSRKEMINIYLNTTVLYNKYYTSRLDKDSDLLSR